MPPRPQSARSGRVTTPASVSSRSGRSQRGSRRGSFHSPARSVSSNRGQIPSSRGHRPQRQQQALRTPSIASPGSGPTTPRDRLIPSPTIVRPGTTSRPSYLNIESVADGEVERNESEGSVVDEIIMAVDMRDKFTVGCAFFNTVDGVLSICQDIPLASFDVVEQLITLVQPTTVLVSGRAPEELLQFLEKCSCSFKTDAGPTQYILRALASSDFANDSAREKLMNIRLDGGQHIQAVVSTADDAGLNANDHNGCATSREAWNVKSLRCGTVVNLDSHVSVNAAGAVLSDILRRRSVGFLPDGQAAEVVFHVRTLQMFSLSDYMFVGAETLQSLQLIQSDLHPNSQSWGADPNGASTRESLSVYGLFHLLAVTPQGRSTLRLIFLRPSLDLDLISERQRTIALFVRPDNADVVKQASQILRRVKNARSALSKLKRGTDSLSTTQTFDRGVWATLRGFSSQALRLREVASNLAGGEEVNIVRKTVELISPAQLMAAGDAINRTIDFEQSKLRGRTSVKAGIDAQLDSLKRRYDGMGSFLTEVVTHVTEELPEWATQYIQSCIFLPQLGFLTVVELDTETGRGKYEGEGSNDDQWQRLFTADGTACYKNKFMKDLDGTYGDMYCEIGDREVEIIQELARDVLHFEDALETTSDICGEFDALLALAKGAEKYAWTCPQVIRHTTSTVRIAGGRHPLQELVVPSFVANDCILEGEDGYGQPSSHACTAMVLTGPNHSGKSIYLKQTAIIVYLAHIGSFVPAEKAAVGLTDKILTRISTQESVSRNESAFAIDLRQVGAAINCATSRSLVLIDELGKGTNADDGAGLLTATLDHFLTMKTGTPRLLLATHFHELFEGDYLANYRNLGVAHMEVRTDLEAGQPNHQITYLFNLQPGHSSSSFGSRCAALNGVPSAIVQRAEAISQLLSRNEDLVSACAQLTKEEETSLHEGEGVARSFLGADFEPGSGTSGPSEPVKSLLTDILTSSKGGGD